MTPRPKLPGVIRSLIAARVARPAPALGAVRHRRACLYKVDRIGDFVVALGALRSLVKHYGADECRLVVSTAAAPLAAAEFPDVARWEVPVDPTGVWREIRPLRASLATSWAREEFGDLVCLRHAASVYRDISLRWIRARRWHGLGSAPASRSIFVGHRPRLEPAYPAQPNPPWSRELLAHRAIVRDATGTDPAWDGLRPRLQSVSASDGDAWVFCPFGSDRTRDFPEERWIEAWLQADLKERPVELLGPAERRGDLAHLADRLRTEARRTNVTTLGAISPQEFVARIARARGVVTVESAAAHLATALDKRAVIVMGGGHFGWLAPWGDSPRQRWLSQAMPCFGCNWECAFSTVRCLIEQSAASVAAAMREVLSDE